VALRVRETIGLFCAGRVTARLQQRTKVERAIRLAALVRAAVTRFCIAEIATLLQEDTEVECRGRIAP
jgi:hypothetical protein